MRYENTYLVNEGGEDRFAKELYRCSFWHIIYTVCSTIRCSREFSSRSGETSSLTVILSLLVVYVVRYTSGIDKRQ